MKADRTNNYQVAALRSEVATLRSQLQENLDLRESLHTQLIAAENRYERSRSKTVQALEARKAMDVKSEEPEELQQKPSSPSVSGSVFWWEFMTIYLRFFLMSL
jgi:E3 ubiquitin-protein ligase BRE1